MSSVLGVPLRNGSQRYARACTRRGAACHSTASAGFSMQAGATLVPLSLPHTQFALPVRIARCFRQWYCRSLHAVNIDVGTQAYYVIACAEAASNLARYDGVRYGGAPRASMCVRACLRAPLAMRSQRVPPATTAAAAVAGAVCSERQSTSAAYRDVRSRLFGAEVQRRILLGSFVLSRGCVRVARRADGMTCDCTHRSAFDEFYAHALRVRQLIVDDFANALQQ